MDVGTQSQRETKIERVMASPRMIVRTPCKFKRLFRKTEHPQRVLPIATSHRLRVMVELIRNTPVPLIVILGEYGSAKRGGFSQFTKPEMRDQRAHPGDEYKILTVGPTCNY